MALSGRIVIRYGYVPWKAWPFKSEKNGTNGYRYRKVPFFYKNSPSDTYTQMISGLTINGKYFGMLGAIDINKPFTLGQLSLVYHLKNMMELAISKSREFTDITEEPSLLH